jgi:hypothetical protein
LKLKEVLSIFFREKWNLRFVTFIGIYLVTTAINLQLRRGIPTKAGSNSPHDDLLGVTVASNILQGNWFGEWDNLVLAKPSGYSFYLVAAHFFPVQLVVLNQIIFCILAFTFTIYARKALLNNTRYKEIICYISYLALIFNPFLFSPEMSRVYRTSAHAMFVFLYVILLFSILNAIIEYRNSPKALAIFRKQMFQKIVAIGLTYTGLIFLRSESFWILVASVLPLIALYIRKSIEIGQFTRNSPFLKTGFFLVFIGLSTYFIPVSLIGQINNTRYGSSLVENYYSGNFAKAIKDWQRVENGKDSRPYVIVSKGQREAVYKISKNAALMSPSLELEPGQGWQMHACNSPVRLCDNSGGWFTWQVRDAAISNGEVKNEVDFQNFFRQISQDINVACDNQTLECGPPSLGVGAKSAWELPISQLIEFTYLNLLSSIPKNFEPLGTVATPDQYQAPGEIVNAYHEVVKYRASPMNSIGVPTESSTLKNLQKVYFPIQTVAFYLSILGYLFAWNHKKRALIFGSLGFGILGIVLCSVGVAVAQVSFGWRVEGPYLLPIQPILQFLCCLGLLTLITLEKKSINLFGRNK